MVTPEDARMLREKNEELKDHLRLLAQGVGVVLRARQEGTALDALFYEAMAAATAKAGVLAGGDPEDRDDRDRGAAP